MKSRYLGTALSLTFFSTLSMTPFTPTQASDIVRIGAGARAMGSGNIAGLADDPLAAMTANPAFLTGQVKSVQVSLQSIWVDADFTSSLGEKDSADKGPGIIPDAAVVLPLENSRWTLGAGLSASSGMLASFDFVDPAGTLGVTYGHQTHESAYAVVNAALAAAYQFSDKLSIGIQAGMAYNRDELKAPYIFQSHPGLKGLKVLVDLEADDYSPTFSAGLTYNTGNDGELYFSFTPRTDFDATGDVTGDLSGLGLFAQGDFAYDVAVQTARPAHMVAGYSWPLSASVNMGVQFDWIGWENAFDNLPILLTNGTNSELNAFLGSTSIADTAPLAWEDQINVHIGGEYIRGSRTYRLGYEFNDDMVPTSTMTPMTGAILKHAISAGLSLPVNNTTVDFAYRITFGDNTRINDSALASPEYQGSALDLVLHSLGIAVRF